jgi:hypothetical protein
VISFSLETNHKKLWMVTILARSHLVLHPWGKLTTLSTRRLRLGCPDLPFTLHYQWQLLSLSYASTLVCGWRFCSVGMTVSNLDFDTPSSVLTVTRLMHSRYSESLTLASTNR